MNLSPLITQRGITAGEMTVRAQAVAANNPDALRWDRFFRRTPANSLHVSELDTVDFRFVAERRPYDTRGIEMPERFGPMRNYQFLPIQARKRIGEEEVERIASVSGNEALILESLAASVPARVDNLARADYRRFERDCLTLWATGQIEVKDYLTKRVALVSLGYDDKYEAAQTAWDDAGENAFEALVTWYRTKRTSSGGGRGVYLSGAVLEAVRADAPTDVNGLTLGDQALAALVAAQAGGSAFQFVVDDRVGDVAATAGEPGYDAATGTAPMRYWPVGAVAVIPQNVTVGEARFSPVRRAGSLGANAPATASDRDVTIVYDSQNAGTTLELQAQLNGYPLLDRAAVDVIDTGITG